LWKTAVGSRFPPRMAFPDARRKAPRMSIGEPKGSVKVIAGKKYGEVLGVHIIGPHATELISLACLAMRNELGIQELRDSLFAHPTLSEAFHEAVLNVWGEAIHFAMDAS